jgi:hypothetical protein
MSRRIPSTALGWKAQHEPIRSAVTVLARAQRCALIIEQGTASATCAVVSHPRPCVCRSAWCVRRGRRRSTPASSRSRRAVLQAMPSSSAISWRVRPERYRNSTRPLRFARPVFMASESIAASGQRWRAARLPDPDAHKIAIKCALEMSAGRGHRCRPGVARRRGGGRVLPRHAGSHAFAARRGGDGPAAELVARHDQAAESTHVAARVGSDCRHAPD